MLYRLYKRHYKKQKDAKAKMIYPDHVESELLKFCEINSIPIRNGIVPTAFVGQVNAFIQHKIRSDRYRTRVKEEINDLKIQPNILEILNLKVTESPIEDYLLNALKEHDLDKHCRPQFEIGTKRVDFAFPIAKLVVECDGKQYHFSDSDQIERDQKRDLYLAKKGWRVLHIEGLAIRRNIDLCIKRIKENLEPFLRIGTAT